MAYCDFVVKYNPKEDSKEDITKRIMYSIWIKRIKEKKPVRIFVAGRSGEGKSYSAITLQQILLEIQGLEIRDYFEAINVFTPLEYPQKIEALLLDKELKKANIICMHEAREIIKATDWQKFLSTAISDVHAMSRTVKRLIFIIISQSIKNITREMRYTIDYYCTVRRPRGKRPRLSIWVMFIDERDLEKPRLRKRKLSGYIQYPSGRRRRFIPTYIEMPKPDKDLIEIFEKRDYESKRAIIKNKLNKLLQELKLNLGDNTDAVKVTVDWYLMNDHRITDIGKIHSNKFIMKKDAKKLHNFDRRAAKRFESLLFERLKEKDMIRKDEEKTDE